MENFEREIKETLHNHTNYVLSEKKEIWNRIESQLNLKEKDNIKKSRTAKKRKIKNKLIGICVIAAVTIFAYSILGTNTGQAIVNQVLKYFEPEKKIVNEIEGKPEEQEVILQNRSDYIIYIDEERYKLVNEEGFDIIVPKIPLEERYPEVSMSILQVVDKTPEQLAAQYSEKLKNTFQTINEIETVTDPVNGFLVSAIDGNEWDSPINKVYIISNGKNGSFVFDLKYFLEAAEGHGARFYYMLEEFEIVEE